MTDLLPKLLPAIAILGSLAALATAIPKKDPVRANKNLMRAAVGVGWAGLLTGAFGIYTGYLTSFAALIGTTGCAGLAVLPMGSDRASQPDIASASGALLPLAVGVSGFVFELKILGEPADAMLLYAAQWAIFCAAMTAALVASAFGWSHRWARAKDNDTPTYPRPLALHARDFALRAVLLGWFSWLVLILIHWRQIGAISMASPADWTMVGALLLATSTLLIFWSKRSVYFEIIFVVYAAVLGLGIYFGAPFGLIM